MSNSSILFWVIQRVGEQIFQLHHLQCSGVSSCQHHWRRSASNKSFVPARGTQTPTITGAQAGEAILRARSGEIIALPTGECQKLGCHLRTHDMPPTIVRASFTQSGAVEAGERINTTYCECRAQHILRSMHPIIISSHKVTP